MFIDKNGKRINPHATIEVDGVSYHGNIIHFPEAMVAIGMREIAEPSEPADYDHELWYRTESDDAPYVIYTKKSDEQIAEIKLSKAKEKRADAVSSIVVTISTGKAFDGHEDAQNRMGRAINILSETDVMPWVLADNSVENVTKAELIEALKLSGLEQARLWVLPYEASK